MLKNVAGQKFVVFAWDTVADEPKTGDAANISAQISKDYGTPAATNDAAPTELDATDHPGIYLFDATQAETNANHVLVSPVSSTPGVVLEPREWFPEDLSFKGIVAHGTAQSASSTGAVIASGEAFADDVLIGMTLAMYGSDQGYWQARIITDNALSGDAVTVPPWTVTPSGAQLLYRIYASAPGASLEDIAAAVRAPITGTVVDDAANSASTFETDRTESTDDHWARCWLRFTSGALTGQTSRVLSYTGSTKFVTTQAFTAEPTAGDTFELVNG